MVYFRKGNKLKVVEFYFEKFGHDWLVTYKSEDQKGLLWSASVSGPGDIFYTWGSGNKRVGPKPNKTDALRLIKLAQKWVTEDKASDVAERLGIDLPERFD